MSWYYASNQQQLGPLTDEELNQKMSGGEINGSTLVWKEGMSDWKPLSEARSAASFVSATPGTIICLCGNRMPQSETVKIGNNWVCASCKDTAIQQLKEGVSTPTPGGPGGNLRYAGFWIRFAAKFIDGILLAVVNLIIQFAFTFGIMGITGLQGGGAESVLEAVMMVVMFLIQLAIQAGYTIYFVGKKGATPGKMLCRLKVVRSDGSALTYGRSTGRYFAEWVTAMTCTIGYIMAAFDEEKRSLHDRIADTRVIQQS